MSTDRNIAKLTVAMRHITTEASTKYRQSVRNDLKLQWLADANPMHAQQSSETIK